MTFWVVWWHTAWRIVPKLLAVYLGVRAAVALAGLGTMAADERELWVLLVLAYVVAREDRT